MTILNQLARIICRQEEGQAMLEYMLLLSLLVALVIASMNIYTGPIGSTYAEIKDGLDMVMGGAAS